jgi:hypothetical protein
VREMRHTPYKVKRRLDSNRFSKGVSSLVDVHLVHSSTTVFSFGCSNRGDDPFSSVGGCRFCRFFFFFFFGAA